MLKRVNIWVLLAIVIAAGSCHRQSKEDAVARAYDHYLYLSDLEGLVGEGVTPEDSVAIVNNYVNQWIQQMVVLEKAKHNVNNHFDKELQNYKNSLITYEYERLIIEQMLDTNVSDADIESYYHTYKDNFILKTSIVKAIYVKMDKESPEVAKVRRIVERANFDDESLDEFQKIASVYGLDYYFDATTWMPFFKLQSVVPLETYNEVSFLRNTHSAVVSDDQYTYLVRILDYKVSDEISPLEVEYDNIRTILLNARKIEVIKDMQRNLLKKAEAGHDIERYK